MDFETNSLRLFWKCYYKIGVLY